MGRLMREHVERPGDLRVLAGAALPRRNGRAPSTFPRRRSVKSAGRRARRRRRSPRARRTSARRARSPGSGRRRHARDLTCDVSEPVLVRRCSCWTPTIEQKRDREHDQEGAIGPHPACIGRARAQETLSRARAEDGRDRLQCDARLVHRPAPASSPAEARGREEEQAGAAAARLLHRAPELHRQGQREHRHDRGRPERA
jgi:hypothetical protein